MSKAPNSVWIEHGGDQRVPIAGTCSIGRAPTNQVILADDRASRRHALIHAQEQNEYWLVDLGSSNGTLLNGRRVGQPTLLRNGDVIEIGMRALVFRQPSTAEHSGAKASDSDATVMDIKSDPCWLLVADIQGSTQLQDQIPPEELPMLIGRWLADCKQLVEECGGSINKFLGDGFFAYWHARDGSAAKLTRAIEALRRVQENSRLPFRFVVHHGIVFRGGASLGEESLSGRDVNFVFRMEKLAAQIGESRMVSEMAASLLDSQLGVASVGRHPLPSFEGSFEFLRL